MKRQSFKPNIIDRDKILVPSNWDSWGKIRILTEGFDLEAMSAAWSIEIQNPPESTSSNDPVDHDEGLQLDPAEDGASAVTMYERAIRDPKHYLTLSSSPSSPPPFSSRPASDQRYQPNRDRLEVETLSMQAFLIEQLHNLEQLRIEDEKDRENGPAGKPEPTAPVENSGRVTEHIGPVQFNMGGIQVDADDMMRKLKVRQPTTHSLRPAANISSTLNRRVRRQTEHRKERPLTTHRHLPATKRHITDIWPISLQV